MGGGAVTASTPTQAPVPRVFHRFTPRHFTRSPARLHNALFTQSSFTEYSRCVFSSFCCFSVVFINVVRVLSTVLAGIEGNASLSELTNFSCIARTLSYLGELIVHFIFNTVSHLGQNLHYLCARSFAEAQAIIFWTFFEEESRQHCTLS